MMEEAYQGLHRYFAFYNCQRPRQALDYQTPAGVYADRAVIPSSTGAEELLGLSDKTPNILLRPEKIMTLWVGDEVFIKN